MASSRDIVPDPKPGTPQALGLALLEAALQGRPRLGDFVAGERHLRLTWPKLSLNDLVQGRRIAIDLAVDAARHPDAGLVLACREAADLVERALTHAQTRADFTAALVRIGEVLDGPLARVA